MDILIFIVAGGLLLFLIGGFGLAMGSLFGTTVKALYNLAEGSSTSPESGQERLYRKMPADLRDIEVWQMTEEQKERYWRFLENYRG